MAPRLLLDVLMCPVCNACFLLGEAAASLSLIIVIANLSGELGRHIRLGFGVTHGLRLFLVNKSSMFWTKFIFQQFQVSVWIWIMRKEAYCENFI